MKAIVKYYLSAEGQKNSILNGGNGAVSQQMEVDSCDPLFASLLEIASIDSDGNVKLDCQGNCYRQSQNDWIEMPRFDKTPTLAEVLEVNAKAIADKIAKKEKEKAEQEERRQMRLAQDRAAIDSWKVKSVEDRAYCWPNLHENESRAELESLPEWAEIQLYRAEKKSAEEAEAERVKAEKEAAQIALRAARGLEDDDVSLNVEDGALAQVPSGLWDSHKRAKNWLAVISPDPSSPGGLARTFCAKAKGDSYYLIDSLSVGDAIEFGADYYSGGGRKSPTRWYGYVKRIENDYIVIVQANTGKAAHKAAKEFMAANTVTV